MKGKETVLRAADIVKVYHRGSEEIRAVDGITLDIRRGEFVSFVGPSGSGKTTLINILGCLDNPTSGRLSVAGREIFNDGKSLSESELTRIRRGLYGYVFQNFYLIPTLTVSENVAIPFVFYKKDNAPGDIAGVLAMLGLDKRADHLPSQLSGGEMQRTAIARALVNRPEILLADEPTGNLDSKRSGEIGRVLKDLNRKEGITIIMVTHNAGLASLADRTVELRDGRLHSGGRQKRRA
jgi:putative ABC transport system ATP-binding protein